MKRLLQFQHSKRTTGENILNILFGRRRSKRGLFNIGGDISKTQCGTLSDFDTNQINNEFDVIYIDNKKITSVLTNHTKVLKFILDLSSTDHEWIITQENMEREFARNSNRLNSVIKDTFMNSKLVLAAALTDEHNEDMNTVMNAINNGKHEIAHPQILISKILVEIIQEFETKHCTR